MYDSTHQYLILKVRKADSTLQHNLPHSYYQMTPYAQLCGHN